MEEVRRQIAAVLGMLMSSVGLPASKSEKMQTKHQAVCKHTCQIHRARKSYSCNLSAPRGLDTCKDVEIGLSLQFSLLNLKKRRNMGEIK